MSLRPVNPILRSLFILTFIICTADITRAQDSTITSGADSTIITKTANAPAGKRKLRRLLPHWNMAEVRSNGPTAAGVMIRVNPAMWVIYYSYEYVVRNVFWVPGK